MPPCRCIVIFSVLLFALVYPFQVAAQKDSLQVTDVTSPKYVRIQNIIIEGNRRTKPQLILREMTLSKGDSIPFDLLMIKMEESRNHLMNIGLFNEVILNIKNWEEDIVDISVNVKERWYTFPVPALDLYDRNFNVWWRDHNHSLNYLQFGLRFYQQNMRGRDEDLRFALLFGYSQLYQVQYNIPYINKKQTIGLKFTTSYGRNRNLTYDFSNNKDLVYENVDQYQKSSFYVQADYIYKPAFRFRYTISLGYNDNNIEDTIAQLNPSYFLNGATRQQYFSVRGTFVSDFRDITTYPLNGSYIELSVLKLGLGLFDDVNIYSGTALYEKYLHLYKKWYMVSQNKIKVSFPKEQPYNLDRGLGYSNDYVNGYEYYIIDGQSFGYTRLVLKNQLLNLKIKTPDKNPFLKGARIPFVIYARAYISAGYVKDDFFYENNPLNNAFLLGGGLGLDVSLIYDTTLRFEYSINKLGEHGLFFHVNSIF